MSSNTSIELVQEWQPGGALGNRTPMLKQGAQYVVAVKDDNDAFEFHAVRLFGSQFFQTDGQPWDWVWSNVAWYAACCDFDLPESEDS